MPDARELTETEKGDGAHEFALLRELEAMRTCADALRPLTEESKRRAMRWLDNAIYRAGNPSAYDEEPPF